MTSSASESRRRVALALVGVFVLILLALGASLIWNKAKDVLTSPHCTVTQPGPDGPISYEVTTEQAANAATMVGVIAQRDLPDLAAELLLAAAIQESKIINIPPGAGDRDSVGVLQQRPSQGWGTEEELNDLQYASGAFLDALVKYDDWQSVPLDEAIQRVQISADGSAYNQNADKARVLAQALLGNPAAAITCEFDKPTVVATASQVAAQVRTDLPVRNPVSTDTTVSVPGAGWQTAAWFVANADRLGIDSVAYNGKRWSREDGWKLDASADDNAVVATMATTASK